MNTGVGKLHQMLFYAGLEPEEYQACLPEIRRDNRKKLRAYLIMTGIFLLVIICLLGGLGALRVNRGYYLLSFVGCLVLLAIEMMLPEDNGLHELNNASGHEKGDQMLQTVALELQGRFGRDNCYRTGGDEFVAFVQDEPETAVRAAVDELVRALERNGCSAAIGVVTQNAGSVDLDTLIRQAEQQMYQAKEEHYRIQRQLEH